MRARMLAALVALSLLSAAACGDDDGDVSADGSEDTDSGDTDSGGRGDADESGDSDDTTPAVEPAFEREFTIESTDGEVGVYADNARVTSGGGVRLLELYLTATTDEESSGRFDAFLACGANYFTGKYYEADAPTPRFPIDETTQGFGIDPGSSVEGWLDLTLPIKPDGETVEGCADGVQLVFAYGIFKDNAVIDLPDEYVDALLG